MLKSLGYVKLKDVTLETIDNNFKDWRKIGNWAKWQLIGLQLQGDEKKSNELLERFKTGGIHHEQRYWLTEANYVLDLLKNEKPIKGVVYDLEKLINLTISEAPFSIGSVYKNREKQPKAPKDPRLEMAKKAVKDENIETGSVTAKQVLELADMGIPEFQKALAQAEQKHNIENMFLAFPEIETETIQDYTDVLCDKIAEIALTDKDCFLQICDKIEAILTSPSQETQVA